MLNLEIIVALVLAYLFGSIPWALVIGKLFYKTDVRQHGSGNLGGSNAGRVLGAKVGFIVTVMDGLKGLITVAVCQWLIPEASIVAGMLCCLGHCFPIFANFKGGKAVATSFGYIIAVSVVANQFIAMALIPFACFMLCLKITKMVSLSSMLLILLSAIASYMMNTNIEYTFSILALWLFVVYRHKGNIKRILNKEEKKISWM